jgi:hypothetical protein
MLVDDIPYFNYVFLLILKLITFLACNVISLSVFSPVFSSSFSDEFYSPNLAGEYLGFPEVNELSFDRDA